MHKMSRICSDFFFFFIIFLSTMFQTPKKMHVIPFQKCKNVIPFALYSAIEHQKIDVSFCKYSTCVQSSPSSLKHSPVILKYIKILDFTTVLLNKPLFIFPIKSLNYPKSDITVFRTRYYTFLRFLRQFALNIDFYELSYI